MGRYKIYDEQVILDIIRYREKGLKLKVIGHKLGISENTVSILIHRNKDRFKQAKRGSFMAELEERLGKKLTQHHV